MGDGSRKTTRAGLTARDRFWLRHIEASTRSRTPATVYAGEHGLSLGALYEAKRRLVRRGVLGPSARRQRVSFARVQVAEAHRVLDAAGPFRLRLVGGAVLEWAAAPAIEILTALIERVEATR